MIFLHICRYLRLKNLKDNKSSGIDNLHSAILKNCGSAFAIPLTYIFKESFKTSKLPVQFRSANITPLYKETIAGNYRPVSLTSSASKIMEGIIICKLETLLYKFKLIVKQQHGFVKNKLCLTNLLETLEFISTASQWARMHFYWTKFITNLILELYSLKLV